MAEADAVPAVNRIKNCKEVKVNNDNKIIKIFTMKQQFPCGPKSSCCGPIGQSNEEVDALKKGIEGLGRSVEIYDVENNPDAKTNQQVMKMIRTFGAGAVPIITAGDEIVCIGQSDINEILSAIKSRL